jgi:hypothetical protein
LTALFYSQPYDEHRNFYEPSIFPALLYLHTRADLDAYKQYGSIEFSQRFQALCVISSAPLGFLTAPMERIRC